jgi:hypothetical protein
MGAGNVAAPGWRAPRGRRLCGVSAGWRRDQLQSFPSRGQTRGADSADALHRLRARNVIYAPKIARACLGTSAQDDRAFCAFFLESLFICGNLWTTL